MANLELQDVEEIVVEWLNSFADAADWKAAGDKPTTTPDPDQYITVDRAGGPRVAMVLDASQILIEVYQKSDRLKAKNKANEIADRIVELKSYTNVTTAEVNSVVHLPDLISQYQRYQVYCDISVRR